MIDNIALTNTYSEQSVVMHQEYGATYILEQVDLGVVKSAHKSYKYLNQVGVYVTSSTLETRDIKITGWVAGRTNAELHQKRLLLNSMINPLHMMTLSLQAGAFILNFLPTTSINYSVDYRNNNEVCCQYLISGFCPDPLFYANAERGTLIAFTTPKFHFPLIIPIDEGIIFGLREPSQIGEVINEGDVYTGMRIVFRARGTVVNPSFTDLNTQQYIKINKTLVAGETVTVNTQEGNKYVQGQVDGVTSNYYGYRDLRSSWLQLRPGSTLYQYDADSNVENLEVTVYFNVRFLEVE